MPGVTCKSCILHHHVDIFPNLVSVLVEMLCSVLLVGFVWGNGSKIGNFVSDPCVNAFCAHILRTKSQGPYGKHTQTPKRQNL
jgi:hypothetical protein